MAWPDFFRLTFLNCFDFLDFMRFSEFWVFFDLTGVQDPCATGSFVNLLAYGPAINSQIFSSETNEPKENET